MKIPPFFDRSVTFFSIHYCPRESPTFHRRNTTPSFIWRCLYSLLFCVVHHFYCHCFLFRSTSKTMSDENRPNHSDHSVQQHSTASNVLSNLLSSFTWAFERPHIDYP